MTDIDLNAAIHLLLMDEVGVCMKLLALSKFTFVYFSWC
jgi:hypothetical protein